MENAASKAVYNPREIGQICGVTTTDAIRWLQAGKLPSFQVPGGHWRVSHDALITFLEREKIKAPEGWLERQEPFRVLIVEDDPDLLEIFTELLHDEPRIEVRAESNGFTAGLQIAGWRPDLILLDFLMPRISRFEICTNLRAHEATRDIPVMALTGLNSEEDKRAIYQCGASDYLGKPFHSTELFRKVRILLGLEGA